jgi:hypothetical protein
MRQRIVARESLMVDALTILDKRKLSVELENKADNTTARVVGINHFLSDTPRMESESGEIYPYKLFAVRSFK